MGSLELQRLAGRSQFEMDASISGAAAAVLVAFVLRHAFRSDEDMEAWH